MAYTAQESGGERCRPLVTLIGLQSDCNETELTVQADIQLYLE